MLTAVAELTTDIERVPESAEEQLRELANHNMHISARHSVITDLQQQLGAAIHQRREQFAEEEAAVAQAAETEATPDGADQRTLK